MARVETRAMERVEQVIADLERLKSMVAQIEARYNFLSHDYTQICEEALSMVNKFKPLDLSTTQTMQTTSRTPHVMHPDGKRRQSRKKPGKARISQRKSDKLHNGLSTEIRTEINEIVKTENTPVTAVSRGEEAGDFNLDMYTTTPVTAEKVKAAPAAEAEKNMGVPALAEAPFAEVLDLSYSPPVSLEALIQFQQKSNQPVNKTRVTPQSVVDLMAKGIEFALDKLGDGLTLPFVLVVRLVRKLANISKHKN